MGLRPETAFGCAFRFLFAPNGLVQKSEAMALARKFSPPQMDDDVLRIGIQVRACLRRVTSRGQGGAVAVVTVVM